MRISNGRGEKKRRNIFGEHSVDKMKSKSPYNKGVSKVGRLTNNHHSDSKQKMLSSGNDGHLGIDALPSKGLSLNRNGMFPSNNYNTNGRGHEEQTEGFVFKGKKNSTTNVQQAFHIEPKPHLPPLDQKAELSLKKRF